MTGTRAFVALAGFMMACEARADYEANVSGRSAGGLGGALTNRLPAAIGAVGVRSGLGRVGMNFRLIDAETSEIVYTKQIESIIRERGLMFGGLTFGGSGVLGGLFLELRQDPHRAGGHRRREQGYLRVGQEYRVRPCLKQQYTTTGDGTRSIPFSASSDR